MKVFFKKSLLEIKKEKEEKDYQSKIKELQEENASLKEELLLTQEAVNELLFADMEAE